MDTKFNDGLRPTGGRGKRSGYVTTHMRVPKIFKERVKAFIDTLYVEFYELDAEEDKESLTDKAIELVNKAKETEIPKETLKSTADSCINISREDFENLLRKVKRSKKSGSKSLTDLARVLLDEPDFEITGK